MHTIRKFWTGSFLSIVSVLLITADVQADLIVNINARINHYSNPVVVHLDAGAYEVTPAGIAGGGLWDAWSTHYAQAGSWKSGYAISSAEIGEMYIPNQASGPYCATPQLALEAAQSTSFELTQSADVRFFIWDGSDGSNTAYDNTGGMSLSIIPEPASIVLMGLVSGNIYFVRRFFMV
jgi:hypothetical protein